MTIDVITLLQCVGVAILIGAVAIAWLPKKTQPAVVPIDNTPKLPDVPAPGPRADEEPEGEIDYESPAAIAQLWVCIEFIDEWLTHAKNPTALEHLMNVRKDLFIKASPTTKAKKTS